MHGNGNRDGDGNWAGPRSSVGDTEAISANAEGEFGRMTFFNPAFAREAAAVTETVAGVVAVPWVLSVTVFKSAAGIKTATGIVIRSIGEAITAAVAVESAVEAFKAWIAVAAGGPATFGGRSASAGGGAAVAFE
jgi:hypothetical protein